MNPQIYEQASDWLVKHRNGGLDAHEKRAFDHWLRESPQHVRAYLEMSSLWEDVPSLDRSWNLSAEELIARARADDNVVPLSASPAAMSSPLLSAQRQPPSAMIRQAPARHSSPGATDRYRNPGLLSALAASILIVCVLGGWLYSQRGVYSTAVGEQRSLTLADGSMVELNARSRIKVRYTDAERHIDLLEGQALFRVAKNKARPFVVSTGDTRVKAVGTAFDVYRAKSGTVVTVVEGKVAVASEGDSKSQMMGEGSARAPNGAGNAPRRGEVYLTAGEQVLVTPIEIAPPQRTNVAAATAWTRRSLVFDAAPLTEVVDEFNRYNARPLVIQDERLADFHVSGVFSSVEPTLLIRFLRGQPELVIEETDTEIRIKRNQK